MPSAAPEALKKGERLSPGAEDKLWKTCGQCGKPPFFTLAGLWITTAQSTSIFAQKCWKALIFLAFSKQTLVCFSPF